MGGRASRREPGTALAAPDAAGRGAAALSAGLLARNAGLNLLGLGLPLVAAVAAMPPLVRGLGTDRFGVLAIVWMLTGYLGELGVGRAATKFVAEALGAGDLERVAAAAWTSLAIQATFGLACGAALAGAGPLLVERVLNVPAALGAEARTAFVLLAAALPVVILSSAVRGILEAAQRFDLVNAVRIPSTVAGYLMPLAALSAGWRLPGVVATILAARVCAFAALVALAARAVPAVRGPVRPRRPEVLALAGYGGWISVSSVISPVLVQLDRLVLGMLATMTAVAYYAAPYEAVNRLVILPASVMATVFPAFSALGGRAEWERVRRLALLALKAILLLVGPVAVALAGGAADILEWWLGADFARESGAALAILTAGVLVNAVAHVPYALLQGVGRADLTAKFHLIELPVQAVLVWVLVGRWGVPGAALAWTLRMALDALLLFGAAGRLAGLSARLLVEARVARAGGLVLGFGALAVALAGRMPMPSLRAVVPPALGVAVVALAWRLVLSEAERSRLLGSLRAGAAG